MAYGNAMTCQHKQTTDECSTYSLPDKFRNKKVFFAVLNVSYLYSPLAKRSEGMIYRYGTLRQITYYFHHSLKLLLAAKLSVCLLDSDLKFRKVKHTQTGQETQDPTRLPIMIYSQEIKVIFFLIFSGKNTISKNKHPSVGPSVLSSRLAAGGKQVKYLAEYFSNCQPLIIKNCTVQQVQVQRSFYQAVQKQEHLFNS